MNSVVRIETDGITFKNARSEVHLAFADIMDARVEDGHLVLTLARGEQSVNITRGDAFALLEAVLDGVAAAHPERGGPYRSAGTSDEPNAPVGPTPAHRLRRRTASVGTPDLWIGRTIWR